MESLLAGISQHGYPILFAAVFLESVGLPIPAAIALLIAGGACAQGSLQPSIAISGAILVMLLGDTFMFLLGRYTGWWLLGLLCRISLNPESCILTSADSFYRRGRVVLVFAKFVPGINTMAPPLAGSMNMRLRSFLQLDILGVALYVSSYVTVGFVFNGALGAITRGYRTFGNVLSAILAAAAIAYLGWQVWMWRKSRSLRSVPFVSAAEAAEAFSSGAAVIYDVRSHGYYDRKSVRIQGSQRLEPNAVHQGRESLPAVDLPAGKLIYLYCTCIREATSARVAQALLEKGVSSAVIRGGLRAWRKARLPLEPVPLDEIAVLPGFN